MQLQIPTIGAEAGPQYAADVNNSLTIIDAHNHSAGSGVLVTPSGLNINSDLPINGNNLTLVFTIRFLSEASPIPNAAPNIGCIYVVGNELYYNDFSGGHEVQITNNGSVNAGAGSITGLPSGTASVSFAASTYVFQSSTNTAANVDIASLILRNNTPSSNGLTLSPPNALGANYTLTLPALPSVTSVMTLDASGNMGTVTFDQVGESMTSVGATAILNTATVNRNVVVSNTNAGSYLGIVRGQVSSGGGVQAGEGFGSANGGTGFYIVTFTSSFADNPAVVITPILVFPGVAQSANITVNGFEVTTSANGSAANMAFSFIAIGQV
jgi:hypothetical protein